MKVSSGPISKATLVVHKRQPVLALSTGGNQAKVELNVLICIELFAKQIRSSFDVKRSVHTNMVPSSKQADQIQLGSCLLSVALHYCWCKLVQLDPVGCSRFTIFGFQCIVSEAEPARCMTFWTRMESEKNALFGCYNVYKYSIKVAINLEL